MARYVKEEVSCSSDHTINLILAVEELNVLTSQELNKLLKKSENFIIQHSSGTGALIQVDMERLALSLPIHLISILVSASEDGITLAHLGDHNGFLKYFLCGFRLLHSLSDLSSRHTRLEQILLEDVRASEQVLDLVFYMLLVLARCVQDNLLGASPPLLHSALVACSFHLLTSYISSQWQDLVQVLLAHPKVDVFIDAAFDVLHVDLKFLHVILSTLGTDVLNDESSFMSERIASSICQHCEASLQFVAFLCQQKLFRDHVLKNKELCKNGGILSMAQTTLDLNIPKGLDKSFEMVAALSRLKSKVLSILLQLCESQDISYLDEVAGSIKSMDLANSVVLKILDLLKAALGTKPLADSLDRRIPKGLVLLNSMRLADIFSDDSNFRLFFMTNMTWVLAEILAMPHEFFLSSWCSTDSPIVEEDAILEYDPFLASGTVLSLLNIGSQVALPAVFKHDEFFSSYPGTHNQIPQVSYAHQRTSYLVKIIANLHCFVPNVCEEQEKDLFLTKFCECLLMDTPKSMSSSSPNSDSPRAHVICRNLCSLTIYAQSLTPSLLNDEDLDLLSLFHKQLLAQFPSESMGNSVKGHSLNDIGDESCAKHSLVLKQNSLDRDSYPNSTSNPSHQMNAGKLCEDIHHILFPGHGPENDNCQFTQEGSAQEPVPHQDGSADADGFSERLVHHEAGNLNTLLKPKDQPDGLTKIEENVKGDMLFVSESVSETPKEVQNVDAGNLDRNNGKGSVDLIVDKGEFSQTMDNIKEVDLVRIGQDEEKPEVLHGEEKQPRKRKRNIMNDKQITLIEKVLVEEPEMQRNAVMLQLWAEKLSLHGSELTPSQLKNWLNNRKARLARAAREARAPSEGENTFPDRSSISHFYDSAESGGEESYMASTSRSNNQALSKCVNSRPKTENSRSWSGCFSDGC